MSNWYRLKKEANSQLGMTLGKWLVLESRGQRDEIGVKNDIMNFVSQNPSMINTGEARSTALNFFVNQTKQQPPPNLTGILDQWLSMVDGNTNSPNNADLTEGVHDENMHAF
jgi:hypothetical protein